MEGRFCLSFVAFGVVVVAEVGGGVAALGVGGWGGAASGFLGADAVVDSGPEVVGFFEGEFGVVGDLVGVVGDVAGPLGLWVGLEVAGDFAEAGPELVDFGCPFVEVAVFVEPGDGVVVSA